MLRVIKTTYGAVLMENAEILHTSIPRGMYAEMDTVQHTANALRDGNGAYRSSEWCALQGSKSSRACPQSSGGCRSLHRRSVLPSSSSIVTFCTLSLSLLLGSASCVRLRTPVYICSAYIHDASCEMTQYGSCVANSCLLCHLSTLASLVRHHLEDFVQR